MNADGQRVEKNVDDTITKLVWDDENILLETDGADATTNLITLEPATYGNVISDRTSGTSRFYHFDALGSTRNLSNADGNVTDTWLYDAWGNILSHAGTSETPFLWIGQLGYYFDSKTGLYLLRRRPLRPTTGRFLTVDPVLFNAENRYAYVRNIVTLFVDPTGLAVQASSTRDTRFATLMDKDFFGDDVVARFFWSSLWRCTTEGGLLCPINIPNAGRAIIRRITPQGAKLEAYVACDDQNQGGGTKYGGWVRYLGSGTWSEWSLWGAIGGAIGGGTGGALAGAGGGAVIGAAGGPIGAGGGAIIGGIGGAIGGGIAGALTFSDEKTATFDLKVGVSCSCRDASIKFSVIHNNRNDSDGDLYWKKP